MLDRMDVSLLVILYMSLSVCLFGSYRVGRYLERRDLTKYFVAMTNETYKDAYQDGFNAGKDWQWQLERTQSAR